MKYDIIKNMDLKQILDKIPIQKVLNFSKKVDSAIVVDIGSKLNLFNVELKGEVKVSAFKSIELPSDKKGEVVLESLRNFIKENNIQHKNAILKSSLDSLLLKRIQLPALPEDELLDAIKWQLKEEVSFDLPKAVIDFSIIKKTTKEDGSKVLDIICVVAEEEEVKKQVLLLKQAGLNCLSVGILPFGYAKLIEQYIGKQHEPLGILHLEDDICYIGIYKDAKLEFYRELPISINKLRESLQGVLVSDKGKIELTSQEAEEVLFKLGVPEKEVAYKDKISSSQVLSMLRPILERLAGEIKRSLTYYDSQFGVGSVGKVFIAGAALKIPNVDKFLSNELSLSVEKFSLTNKLSVSSGINQDDLSESYASAGLALDYNQGINLLPHEFRTEKFEKVEKISLRWVAIIVVSLLAIFYIFAKAGIGAYQKRLDSASIHLNVMDEVKQIKAKADELNNFISDVKVKSYPAGAMLKKISSIAGPEIFFNDFSIDFSSKSGSINGFVKCINKNPQTVLTNFVRQQGKSGYFGDVSISSVDEKKEGGFDIADFMINFKLP